MDAGFEWECEHCGERTPKHNPPCSNCGGMQLAQVKVDAAAEAEAAESLVGTSRRALVGYGVAGAVAVGGGGYLMYDAYTPPEIPDAPGEGESAGGLSLSAAEDEALALVNEEREASLSGEATLSTSASVRDAARYATAYTVVEPEGGNARELFSRLDEFHVGTFRYLRRVYPGEDGRDGRAIDGFEDADALGAAAATSWLRDDDARRVLVHEEFTEGAVDAHVDPEGRVYVSIVVATGGGLV